jgi:hypothetical protein
MILQPKMISRKETRRVTTMMTKKLLIHEINIIHLTNFPSLMNSVHLLVLEGRPHPHQPTEAGMAVLMSVQLLL